MRQRWFAGVMILIALLISAPWSVACELRVGWTPYGVYTFADADGQVRGIDADLITATAAEIGCHVSFRELPWARILLELRNGQIDATCSASRTEEREAFALFSDTYRMSEVAIFVRRNEAPRFPLASFADIVPTKFRLGIISGYYYGDTFVRLSQDPAFVAQLDLGTSYAVNIQKLLNGRIDGVLVDDVGVMRGEVKKLGASAMVERHPLIISQEALHFMFSRASVAPQTVTAVNAAISQMRQDGRRQAIFDRYLE